MGNLLTSFKTALPDKAIVLVEEPTDLPENAVGLIFAQNKDCEDVELVKRGMRANKNMINTKEQDYLAISKSTPVRIQCVKAGDRLPRNHYPVASWDGENIRVALPVESDDLLIQDVMSANLVGLIGEEADKEEYLALCKGLSLGITSEKDKLSAQEKKNRRDANTYMEKAEKYLEAADRDARLIANLDKLEKEESTKHAKEEWELITEMIPKVIQKAWIENDRICILTAPIVLLGNFMGVYRIHVMITTGEVSIHGATPGVNTEGNPHPHVSRRDLDTTGSNICWGNYVKTYAQLKASKSYSQLIQAALRLLTQYNHDSPYTTLEHWGSRYSNNREDAATNDCKRRGPNHSLAQARKCLSCEGEDCKFKRNNSKDIYNNCYKLSSAKDCVSCEYKECPHYVKRFDRCWTIHQKTGPAFCMLRCAREECSHRKEANTACSKSNLRKDGTCPASDKCWNPCVKTGE